MEPGRILVVDDEPLMRDYMVETLERSNYEVEAVNSGAAAIEKIGPGRFDLVITDIRMSGVTGMDVLKAVSERSPETKVVMVTAFGTKENAQEALALGAFDYIFKPFSPDEIESVIERALEAGPSESEADDSGGSRLAEKYISPEDLEDKTGQWLAGIAPWNARRLRFDLGGAALVVVDMQRFFCEPGGPLYTENSAAIVPVIRRLLEHFRNHDRPVVFAAQQNKGESVDRGECLRTWWLTVPLEGTREVEVIDALAPSGTEKVIPKRRYSAFFGTDLELTLRSMGVSQVVVVGLFTNVCVEATVRDAFMRDFLVFLPADACASLNEQMHLAALRTLAHWYAKVVSTAELIQP